MGTSQNVEAWNKSSTSPQGDSAAPFTEGQTAGSLNNHARAAMAGVAKWLDDLWGGLTAGGTANALTLTTNRAVSEAHVAAGFAVGFWASADNTSTTVTLTIDGLTARNVKLLDGTAPPVGSIKNGSFYIAVFAAGSTEYRLLNAMTAAGLDVTALAALTTPDLDADYLLINDDGVGNKKVLPRYLAPSARASFAATKGGTDQAIATTSATKITFGTEVFDVGGGYDASNSKWTPPAGTCLIAVLLAVIDLTAGAGGAVSCEIRKNGSAYARATIGADPTFSFAAPPLYVIDQASGTDYYEVFTSTSGDSAYNIFGDATRTRFMGTML